MKIATLLLTVICVPLVYSKHAEVPFGSSNSTAFTPGLLDRRDSAVSIPSTNDKASASEPNLVQTAVDFDPTEYANDASWDKYKKKGNWLHCLMEMPDEVAGRNWPNYLDRNPPSAASQWKGTLEGRFYPFHHHPYAAIDTDMHPAELRDWYWHEAYYDPEINCDFSDDFANLEINNRIEAALNELGLDTKPVEFGGKNKCYSIEHMEEDAVDDDGYELPVDMQTYFPDDDDDKEYGATGAYYRFAFNAEQGAIYGHNFLAPWPAAMDTYAEGFPADQLPLLRQASDIMAAFWLRNPNPKNLKYWFGSNIINAETVPVVNRILVSKGYKEVPEWPGVQVDDSSEEYLALLGTPVGANKAFMLLQHKAELGLKHIPSITIFRDTKDPSRPDDAPAYQLLFRIEDVPQDEVMPDDTEIVDQEMTGSASRMRRGQRKDSLVELDLGKNVGRLHRVSIDGRGETMLQSHEFEREL
ncbi:uncharacterized protein J4E92_009792 [Alternaria infectoria]|uniref:uncharacterized protein n=1 Tax=Alternaria infectoria TaxID=45303 RepID=UPI00221F1F95|nr:uncharacterized protein J4E92_009792 [Alternaria infectoria]KAI4913443.1 hypothetical protein J4E92_009792 [Alternaria infectoria]